MPLYGNELDRDTNPFEANLGRVVKLEKGEFIGRAALAGRPAGRAGAEAGRPADGRQRHPRAGYAVRVDGQAVGRVTSGTASPTLGTQIAMARVPADAAPEVGDGSRSSCASARIGPSR